MGEVRDGLYHYKLLSASVFHSQRILDSTLWYQRLGHPSTSSIPTTLNFPKSHLPCDVCARAKHTRLPFFLIQIRAPFVLIGFIVIYGVVILQLHIQVPTIF